MLHCYKYKEKVYNHGVFSRNIDCNKVERLLQNRVTLFELVTRKKAPLRRFVTHLRGAFVTSFRLSGLQYKTR